MCRCEVVLYVQKLRDLQSCAAYVQMINELGPSSTRRLRIGLTERIDSHPDIILPYNYSYCKENRRRNVVST